jgi:hypothetical protein
MLQYPAYKLKKKATTRCATMGCHVSRSSGPRLLAKVDFGATTCPSAPDPASLLG